MALLKRGDDLEPAVALWVNGKEVGELRPVHWFNPGIALGSVHVLVWSGVTLFVWPLAGGPIQHYRQNSEISAAYLVGGSLWCLACELDIVLFDIENGAEVSSFGLSDVLVDDSWDEDYFLIKDWQGNCVRFFLPPTATELVPEVIAQGAQHDA
jgi:hypothetical protein